MRYHAEMYTSEIQPIRSKSNKKTEAVRWAKGSSSKTEGRWNKLTPHATRSSFDELFDYYNNQHAPF